MSHEAFEAAAYECLSVLAGVETHDIDLRDHPGAWQAIEAFAAVVQADAYERAAKVCRDQWYATQCADAIRKLAKESNS